MPHTGHIYPSEYALRFSERTDYPATHEAIVDESWLRRCETCVTD